MPDVAVYTNKTQPIVRLLNPVVLARSLWTSRELIRQFTIRMVRSQHQGTMLGVVWDVLTPVFILVVYTFIFSTVLKVKWDNLPGGSPAEGGAEWAQFAVTMFCGMIVFGIFADCATAAPTMIVSRPNYVKKVVFPLEVFPIATLGAALFSALVSTVILIVAAGVAFGMVSKTAWLFPLVLVPTILLTLGVSWFLASLGVFLRDTNQFVNLFVQRLLFFVTPIFYPMDRVPEQFLPILRANPFATLVVEGRKTLLWGQYPDFLALGILTIISLVVCQLGYAWFMKSRRGFGDVI